MTEEHYPRTSAEIVVQMETQKRLLDDILENLSDAAKNAAGTLTDWAVKDHLSHLAVWMNGIIALVKQQSRWQAMGLNAEWYFATKPHFDDMNAIIYIQHKHLNFDDARAMLNTSHNVYVAMLNHLSEEDLQKPYSHYQPHEVRDDGDTPIVRWIVGDSYEHYEEHLAWIQERIARDEHHGA